MVTDESCFQVLECYLNFVEQLSSFHIKTESRVTLETAYQRKVEGLLNDENCFKIVFVSRGRRGEERGGRWRGEERGEGGGGEGGGS